MLKKGKNRTLIKLNQLQLNDGIQIKCLADPCQLIENVFVAHLDVDYFLHAIEHTCTHTYHIFDIDIHKKCMWAPLDLHRQSLLINKLLQRSKTIPISKGVNFLRCNLDVMHA